MTDNNAAFSPDPRGHMLAVVLMAGFSLRSLNRLRREVPGGLNGAHALLDILLADREARSVAHAAATPAAAPEHGIRQSRSILAISAAVGVPRETIRRNLSALAETGWLEVLADGGVATTAQTRRRFALEEDASGLAEFIWIGSQVRATLTAQGEDLDRLVARHPWHVALATQRESLLHLPYAEAIGPLVLRCRDATPTDKEAIASMVDGYLYRHMNRLRAVFAGDLLLPVLIGEIAHRNVSALAHRTDATVEAHRFGATFADRATWDDVALAPVNAHSLSQSTGIPDSTVRRKIAYLSQRGWIAVDPNGLLSVTPDVRIHSTALNAEALVDMMSTLQTLRALGIAE